MNVRVCFKCAGWVLGTLFCRKVGCSVRCLTFRIIRKVARLIVLYAHELSSNKSSLVRVTLTTFHCFILHTHTSLLQKRVVPRRACWEHVSTDQGAMLHLTPANLVLEIFSSSRLITAVYNTAPEKKINQNPSLTKQNPWFWLAVINYSSHTKSSSSSCRWVSEEADE